MKFVIYAQNEDGPRVSLATITAEDGDTANSILDMLFDYGEFAEYNIFYDSIWAEKVIT